MLNAITPKTAPDEDCMHEIKEAVRIMLIRERIAGEEEN